MSDQSSPDSAVDRAIDRAVRQIMSAEPPAGLRRRVLVRIEASPARPPYAFRFAMAAAACAVLVLGVVMFTPSSAPAPEAVRTALEPTAAPSAAAPAPAPAPAATQPQTVATSPASRRTFTTTDIRMPRIGNVFGAREARVTPTAAAVADVVFPASESGDAEASTDAPGSPRAIGITLITVPPIQVESIRVEPVPVRR